VVQEVFVECDVSPGMFSDELVVQVAGHEYLVPKERVRSNGSGGSAVRAKLVTDNDGEWVVLPTEYGETVSRKLVKVRE
jgi:hypothetical protein